jgi:hypothetical protein
MRQTGSKFWLVTALVCAFTFLTAGLTLAAEKEIHFGYLVADQLHSPAVIIMKEKKIARGRGSSR